MNTKKLPLKILATVAVSSLFLTACDDSRVRVSANIGPGHHHGHHGKYLTHTPHRHRVSYNSALGLYTVIGFANTYYSNGHYYRYRNKGWHRSRDYRSWSRMNSRSVPQRLFSRYKQPRRDRVTMTRVRPGSAGAHARTRWLY